MGDLLGLEPVPHSLKVPRGRRPRAHLLAQRLARLAYEQASHDRLLVDIQPTATLDESSHDHLHIIIRRRTRRRRYDEDTAIRAARFRARQRVVPLCSAGRTAYRGRKPPQVWSALTRSPAPRMPHPAGPFAHIFTHGGARRPCSLAAYSPSEPPPYVLTVRTAAVM